MKRILGLSLLVLVSACTPPEKPERIYTVDEYMQDEAKTAEQMAKCRSNPGELQFTPNCINASEADQRLSIDAQIERMQKQ